jgi:ABC-type dipeptide/oligopeptide/nickel transport system ATPase component
MKNQNDCVLDVKDLKVEFDTYGGTVKAVRGVSYRVRRGKTLGVVGESGCGKSVTVQAILQLIPMPPGRITSGSARLNGKEMIGMSAKEINTIRGREVGVIFQDPMSSLNPTMKIGKQIAETVKVHQDASNDEAMQKAISLLEKTKIPEATKRADQYPFEFSGGMLQRAVIAMSMACDPTLLVADEPTTALDVTIQAQTLEVMHELQKNHGMSIILITHDLGVIA